MWQTRQPRHWHANFSFRCSSACRLGVSCPLKADNVGRTSSTCRDEPTGWCHARLTACLAKGCPFLRELCNHLEDMNPRIMNVKQLRFQRVTSVLEGSTLKSWNMGRKWKKHIFLAMNQSNHEQYNLTKYEHTFGMQLMDVSWSIC